jgi:uncharacterized protein DUF5980
MKGFVSFLLLSSGAIALACNAPTAPSPSPVAGAPLEPSAATSPTWQLVDNHQSLCFSSRNTTGYYAIWIRGRWARPIQIGITGLPSGASSWTSYAPIPPGSSTGIYSLAYVGVQLPATTPLGTYTASLWARESRTTQAVPVTLVVKSRCGY